MVLLTLWVIQRGSEGSLSRFRVMSETSYPIMLTTLSNKDVRSYRHGRNQ